MMKNISTNIFTQILVAIAITLVLPMTFNNIAIGLYIIFLIFNFKKLSPKGTILLYALPLIIYALDVLSLLNSEDLTRALKILEKRSSMLIFGFGFLFLPKLSNKKTTIILDVFVISLFVLCIIALIKAFIVHYDVYGLNFNYQSYWLIGHHNFSSLVGFHATYLSNYILFAMSIIVFNKSSVVNKMTKIKVLLLLVFLACFMIMSVRTCFVTFIFIIIFALVHFFRKNKKQLFIGVLITVFGTALLLFSNTMLRERFEDIISIGRSENTSRFGGSKLRMYKWESAYNIFKENPIIGVGNGDIQHELEIQYKNLNQNEFNLTGYNTHNQYLNELAAKGLFGLVALLLFVSIPIYLAFKYKQPLLIILIIINLVSFLTENVLTLNKGIVLIFFFYGVLCSNLDFKRHLSNGSTTNS